MGNDQSITQLKDRIERLSADLIMLNVNTREHLKSFLKNLRSACIAIQNNKLNNLNTAFNMIFEYLTENEDKESSEKIYNMLMESVSTLQGHLDSNILNLGAVKNIDDIERLLKNIIEIPADKHNDINCQGKDVSFIYDILNSINDVENTAVKIDKNIDDYDVDDLNYLFEFFHNIRTESEFRGILCLIGISVEAESVIEDIIKGELKISKMLTLLLLNIVNVTKELLLMVSKQKNDTKTGNISTETTTVDAKSDEPKAKHAATKHRNLSTSPPKLNLEENGDLLCEFISESKDHLTNAENSLLALEKSSDSSDEINKIFRAFHTIKGIASFLQLSDIAHLTHETETMMDYLRKGTFQLQTNMVDAILESIDSTGRLLCLLEEQLSNNGILISEYYDVSPTITKIQKILSESQSSSNQPQKKIGEILIENKVITTGQLEKALKTQHDEDKTRKLGVILMQDEDVPQSQIEKALDIQKSSFTIDETIKISVEKLDHLIDMVGELVITGTQVIQNEMITSSEDNRLINDVRQLTRIIRDIQDVSINMRLVPISPLFNKMIRLVRDLSNKLNKEIEVKLSGEDTEIDKNIIDSLSDPLMHLLRNAIDHGIETPEKRSASGKKTKGLIELRAYHKSGYIVIEIKDDGQGLNKEKILKTAIQKGLVKEHESLTDSRIYNLIFEPGFSTADKITDVSGRGVGMDVVRKNIDKLRGKIDIESVAGKGTSFIIKLPLTLAIIDGIIMRSGRERYILPIFSIIEFIQPRISNISTITEKGELISVHDELYQIVRLNEIFKRMESVKNIEDMTGCILDSDYGKCCLLVDELIGQQQVVIKSLGDRFKNVQGVSGGAILGDGKVGLIIDANALVGSAKGITKTQ